MVPKDLLTIALYQNQNYWKCISVILTHSPLRTVLSKCGGSIKKELCQSGAYRFRTLFIREWFIGLCNWNNRRFAASPSHVSASTLKPQNSKHDSASQKGLNISSPESAVHENCAKGKYNLLKRPFTIMTSMELASASWLSLLLSADLWSCSKCELTSPKY